MKIVILGAGGMLGSDLRRQDPYLEDDAPAPVNVYGPSKLQGERYPTEYVERQLLLRTAWLYGFNGRNFVRAIIEKAATAQALEVVSDQVGSPTFTCDLAFAAGAGFISALASEPSVHKAKLDVHNPVLSGTSGYRLSPA